MTASRRSEPFAALKPLPFPVVLLFPRPSVTCRVFLDLQQLSFDGAHAGHQPVELGEELSFVPAGDLDEICGGSMANAMKRVRQPSVQKPHLMLQVQELLVKLGLLEHGRDLA
jgi:hypothetical protein